MTLFSPRSFQLVLLVLLLSVLLQPLCLQPLCLQLLRLPLLVKSSNLPFHLILLQYEVIACELELRDDFFGRRFLVAFALLGAVSSILRRGMQSDCARHASCLDMKRGTQTATTYPLDFLIGLQSSAVDGSGNCDGSDGAGHDPSTDGLNLWCGHGLQFQGGSRLSNALLFAAAVM